MALAVSSALALAAGLACSGKTLPYAGGLMLSIQTDLSAPKDVAAVGLFITSDGRPVFSDTRDVAPNGEVRFPATIAILGDEARPRAQIKIRVAAFKNDGEVRILRDILTTVPKGRTALLRAPLLWINEGSGKGQRNQIVSGLSTRDTVGSGADGFAKITSACPDGQTFLEGECGDATVDSETLPDYQEKDVFGGGTADGQGGRCFDVLACFGAATRVDVDLAACSASLAGTTESDPNLSFAVALPPSAAVGECRGDSCLVPLDKGTGWKGGGAGVTFPKAVCARIQSGAALGIVRTGACPTKDAATPSCGPASRVATSSAPPGLDGGSSSSGSVGTSDFEPAVGYGGEPGLSSVAIDQDGVFVARSLADPPPSGIVKLARADVIASKNPAQLSIVTDFAAPQTALVQVGPLPKASTVAVSTTNGVRICDATVVGPCQTFPFQAAGGPPVIALGASELYVFGSTGGPPGLFAIPLAAPALEPRIGPSSAPVSSMHYSGGRLFFGGVDGSISVCTVPCQTAGALTEILPASPSSGIVTALATDDRVPGKLFGLRVPGDGVTLAQGGVFSVSTSGGGEQQLASGTDVFVQGAPPPLAPPAALAVDSEYVYWGGAFTDARDGARKYGLVRRKHASSVLPAEGFPETAGQNQPVSAVVVDGTHVFWSYVRADAALVFATKKRAF